MDEDKEKIMTEQEKEDQEEYERALEVLNRSKSSRVKEITEQKKARKLKESRESSDASKPSGFIDKCRKDPVIPICVLLLIAAVIGFGLYFILPMFSVKSLGVTVDDYRARYVTTGIYNNALLPYNFAIPEVTYTEGNQVALTASAEGKNKDKLLYFSAAIPNTATSFGTAIQGSVRRTDNEITALRVVAGYEQDDNYVNFLILYFGSYLQAFIPDVSDQDIQTLVADAINNISSTDYMIRQDIAYNVSIINDGTARYVAFDIIPASNIAE